MLALEERFMIRELYRKGVSISEIARRTDEIAKPFGKSSMHPSSHQPGTHVK